MFVFIYPLHNIDIVSLVQSLGIYNCLLLLIIRIKEPPWIPAVMLLLLPLLASRAHCPGGGQCAFTVHIQGGWSGPRPKLCEIVSMSMEQCKVITAARP